MNSESGFTFTGNVDHIGLAASSQCLFTYLLYNLIQTPSLVPSTIVEKPRARNNFGKTAEPLKSALNFLKIALTR